MLLGGVPGRGGRQGDGHRRRRGRPERGRDRDRDGRGDLRLRPLDRPPARARGHSSTARCSTCFASTLEIEARLPEMDLVIGAVLVHGAKAPHVITRDAARADEAQRRARRRLDRPGRLLRDLAADDAHRPHLRGRRHHALLRGQHAGRGADHLDLRADERDDALRRQARRPGRRTRALERRPGLHGGPQRRRRQGHLRAGRARPGPGVHAAAGRAGGPRRRPSGARGRRRPRRRWHRRGRGRPRARRTPPREPCR